MIQRSFIDQLTAEAHDDGVQQLVVGAVIANNSAILLLRRPADDFMGGIYELASGKVEPGEILDEALIREVKEESGLDIEEITRYLGSFDYTSGSGKKTRQFNFAVTVTTTEPVILQEHDEYRWTPIADEPPVTDAVKQILARYREEVAA
jgi:8-oxo-dGTP diphosphatase